MNNDVEQNKVVRHRQTGPLDGEISNKLIDVPSEKKNTCPVEAEDKTPMAMVIQGGDSCVGLFFIAKLVGRHCTRGECLRKPRIMVHLAIGVRQLRV